MRYVKFLQDHDADFSDRTVHNIFQAANTLLRKHGINDAGPILRELGYAPAKVRVYSEDEMRKFFAACEGEDEELPFKLLLHSGMREDEFAHAEWGDLDAKISVVHIQPKPHRGFRLKSKRNMGGEVGDRYVPIEPKLTKRLVARMQKLGAKPGDLMFPNSLGSSEGHLLRKCKVIAGRAKLSGKWTLHSWRKTFATRLHDAGVPVGTIMVYLGHTSLKTTLLYLGLKADKPQPAKHAAFAAYV